jgi:hypothetical protein
VADGDQVDWSTRRVSMALMGAFRTRRVLRARVDLGFINLLALCVLTIAFLVLGFSFRPSASEPAQIPNSPMLTIHFSGSTPLRDISVYSYLVQTASSQAKLIVSVTSTFKPEQTATSWTMDIQDFTGYFCTPKHYQASLVPLGPYDYQVSRTSPIPTGAGEPFLVVSLCWNDSPPLTISGSYFSAALPPILAPSQGGTLTRGLDLLGTSLSAYTPVGGIPPTKVTPQTWAWTSALSDNFESQANAEIPVIGSSIPGIARDNRNAFYSGIFFGIAGGASVAMVSAFLDVVDKRKAKSKASAGGGSPAANESAPPLHATEESAHDPAPSHSGSDSPHRPSPSASE